MRGVFVTGTDTGVGKTAVAAATVAALRADGLRVAAFKPAVSGLDEDPGPNGWPIDHELLASLTGQASQDVSPHRYGPAVSPHLAAEQAADRITLQPLIRHAERLAAEHDVVVGEGAGGLLVPLGPNLLIRDVVAALRLPIVVVARPGLGTINHTLLTLAAARAAGIAVRAVVLNRFSGVDAIERSNLETLRELARCEVLTLGEVALDDLAVAGAALEPRRWL